MNNIIRWKNGSKIDLNKISIAEKSLGIKFPLEYKNVIQIFNGGEVEPFFFNTKSGNESIIGRLYTLDEVIKHKNKFENVIHQDIPKEHEDHVRYLSLLPFAFDPGNAQLCFDYYQREEPAVIFLTDVYDIDFVAETFEEFLDSLYEESIEDE